MNKAFWLILLQGGLGAWGALSMGAWPVLAAGTVYYVAPTGSDSHPGTQAQPWQTIGKAAETLVAGDTVLIEVGTYKERVEPRNSGSAGAYITYTAFPGSEVTIDGKNLTVPEWSGLFDITGKAYIRVSGLRVINSGSNPHNTGILVDTSSHILIENNHVFDTNDSGIGVWSSQDVVVDGNEVGRACRSGYNECISVGGTDRFEIRNNMVFDSNKEGIDAKDGSSNGKISRNHVWGTVAVGFYVEATDKHTYNIEVYDNVAHNIAENGFAIASELGGYLENIRLYNNVAYNNGWSGIHVTACCISTHPMSNIWIVNNTFCNNGYPHWGGGINMDNPQAVGVVIRNNICSGNLTFQIAIAPEVSPGNYTADHNLIDGYRNGEGEITGSDYVEGDPLLQDPASGDFHLRPGSPAIGAGSPDGAPLLDMDDFPRPNPPGLGTYEYQGSLRGDLDGNKLIQTEDLVMLSKCLAGILIRSEIPEPDNADVNADGRVDARDCVALARLLAQAAPAGRLRP